MARNPEEKENRQSPEQIRSKQDMPQTGGEYDPFSEESTDYRAPGEKFETLGEGENLDRSRMDQPRSDMESMPKALKEDLGPATRRPLEANDAEEKKLFEERRRRMKKVA